ncbi:hypothetical protein [Halomarina oriensis]|uniref:Uncharacterized protein n=1 Tax=Halomarina oriensis TaxID=671145 RepID=A0A6B0GY71_9EURY|nr:hypothetical protein [Halomarina oriensis]MWG36738.1 hypothetical protein [Halomarina oriensis]
MSRGLPGGPGPGALGRLPFVRSLSYHTRRVLGHPIRTGLKVVTGIVMLVGAYLLVFRQEALMTVVARDSVGVLDVLALVDPWLWPVVLVGGTILVVVVEIWTGVQQDMRYGRGR